MSRASWSAALRIARREAWRGKLRSVLVLALIGLPILVLSAVDVISQTYELTPGERVGRVLGAADADIAWVGDVVVTQSHDGNGWSSVGPTGDPSPPPTTADLAAHLPAGSRLLDYRHAPDALTFYTPSGLSHASLVGLDYADPIAAGLVRQDSGRAPRSTHEIAISRNVAHDTGLGVGDLLRTTDRGPTYRIVGVVTDRDWYDANELFTVPAAIPASAATNNIGTDTTSWLVDTPRALTWSDVTALDKLGFATSTRQMFLHPVPDSAAPSTKAIATSTLVGGMVLLEIVLLAGPAFAVGAHRRRRELALIAAVGGRRSDLRRVVLADALVLGSTAGVVGVLGGIGVAAASEGWVLRFANALPGPFDVPWLHLIALVLVSIATAVLAALVPAMQAARTDVVAALAGRRGIVRTRARVPLLGAVLAAVGVVVVLGAFGTPTAQSVLAGVALVEVGLITASPWLIALVSRIARWLPLSGRIALRDASRNRTSAAPAVAAVMATVIGAMAAVIGTASAAAQDRNAYLASLPQRDTYVSLDRNSGDAGAVVAAMHKAIPGARISVVDTPGPACTGAPGVPCTSVTARFPPQGFGTGRGWGGRLPEVLVVGPDAVDAVLGHADPAAAAALRAGRALVIDASMLTDGTVTLEADHLSDGGDEAPAPATQTSATVPATALRSGYAGFQLAIPPSVAARLSAPPVPAGVLASTDHPLTSTQRQALAAGLASIGDGLRIDSEHGYSNRRLWLPFAMVGAAALVAVLAALIATALANVDSRPDLTLLAAVGASPRTRRVLSLSRAVVIAGIGTVIGAIAGLLPARAWVESVGAPVVIPWVAVGVAVVAIPAVAGMLAWLFTRARLPSERAA